MEEYKDVVYSTRIRFARNLRGLPFPNRLQGEEEIYSVLMRGAQEVCDKQFKSTFCKMDGLDGVQGQMLVEKHLISPELLTSPYGAALISEDETISVMINEEDHVREQCVLSGYRLDEAFKRLTKLDEALDARLHFAADAKYGYLTACPTNLGAAMRASVMLFLPALTLTDSINSFIKAYQESGFTTRGVYGEGSKAQGYLYQLSNQAAIGLSEAEILGRMNVAVKKLAEAERLARKNLSEYSNLELRDEIMRAYGILRYSVKIASEEFMEKLAMVKLGVNLGYIEADMEKLNRLTVMAQPAMLCTVSKKKLNAEERDVVRSALVKKML